MLFFVQKLGLQAGVLAGGLTLVVMILPTIVRTTQESLKTVPQSYREGALALGSGQVAHGAHRGAAERRGRHRDRLHSGGRAASWARARRCSSPRASVCVLNDFVTALQSSSATLTVALYVYANERGEIGRRLRHRGDADAC